MKYLRNEKLQLTQDVLYTHFIPWNVLKKHFPKGTDSSVFSKLTQVTIPIGSILTVKTIRLDLRYNYLTFRIYKGDGDPKFVGCYTTNLATFHEVFDGKYQSI